MTGRQMREVGCLDFQNKKVSEAFCDSALKPKIRIKSCNLHLCPARCANGDGWERVGVVGEEGWVCWKVG